jgi:hypothetical protein
MGERYQSHIIINHEKGFLDKNENQMKMSIHMQWCYGHHIIKNMYRVLNTLNKSNLEYLDTERAKDFIHGILAVNKSLEGKFYPYRIHLEEPYKTFNGDSNHGWNVIKVDVNENGKTKITSRFYDYSGNPVSNDKLLKDAIEELEYEFQDKPKTETHFKNVEKIKKMCTDKLFNNTQEDLQKTFNENL